VVGRVKQLARRLTYRWMICLSGVWRVDRHRNRDMTLTQVAIITFTRLAGDYEIEAAIASYTK